MAYTDYDTIGTGYDGTRQADAYLVGRLLTLLDRPPGSRILDVGCGTGNYTSALQVLGLSMTGVEPSERMLAEARTKDPE
ncbi:MAG: methyltransferase domain-containing protein, partial [Flavobacteriales bacterium]|nr:methyltransferase domain-containing protein [Flavobacteriales bacterium]